VVLEANFSQSYFFRLRRQANNPNPARPAPSRSIVEGSGTSLIIFARADCASVSRMQATAAAYLNSVTSDYAKVREAIISRKRYNLGRSPMRYWYYFWIVNFVVAGSTFAVIAAIVLVRGIGDLRTMFSRLRSQQQ
jgi:hypothetical protein